MLLIRLIHDKCVKLCAKEVRDYFSDDCFIDRSVVVILQSCSRTYFITRYQQIALFVLDDHHEIAESHVVV